MTKIIDKYAALSEKEKKLIKLLKSRGFAKDETICFMFFYRTDEDCAKIIAWIEEHPDAQVEDIVGESFRMRGLI